MIVQLSVFNTMRAMLENNASLWLYGLRTTLLLAFVGTVVGLLLALVLVVMKIQTPRRDAHFMKRILVRLVRRTSILYVGFFRGTPMMVQAMLLYYGLQSLGLGIPVFTAGLVVVSLNTAAYLTEVLRAGLAALHKGQKEAALALGMSPYATYRFVLFPQALKNMVPAIGNELVVNLKDTAVLSVIGVTEMFYMGRRIGSARYQFTESFIIVSLLYLLVVNIAVWLLGKLTNMRTRRASIPRSDSGVMT